MPRFFIDTDDGDNEVRDEVGHTCENAEAARQLALAALPEMAGDTMPDGDRRVISVRVRDEAGAVLYEATLALTGEWTSKAPAVRRVL